jgi:hypothetical protein
MRLRIAVALACFVALPLMAREARLEGEVQNRTKALLRAESVKCSNGTVERGSGKDVPAGEVGTFTCDGTMEPRGSSRYAIFEGNRKVGSILIEYPSTNSRQQYKGFSCQITNESPTVYFCVVKDATTCDRYSDRQPCVMRYRAEIITRSK